MELYVFGLSEEKVELPGTDYPKNYRICGTVEELEGVITHNLAGKVVQPLTFLGIKQGVGGSMWRSQNCMVINILNTITSRN